MSTVFKYQLWPSAGGVRAGFHACCSTPVLVSSWRPGAVDPEPFQLQVNIQEAQLEQLLLEAEGQERSGKWGLLTICWKSLVPPPLQVPILSAYILK